MIHEDQMPLTRGGTRAVSQHLQSSASTARRFVKGRSKYRAVRTEVNGVPFASKREAADYCELKLREKLGEIDELELQPVFPIEVISPIGEVIQVAVYKADFRFREVASGERIVTDSKGFKTPVYRLKKKLVEALYGILILET